MSLVSEVMLRSVFARLKQISARPADLGPPRKVLMRWRLIPVVCLYLYAGGAAWVALLSGLALLVGTGYVALALLGFVEPRGDFSFLPAVAVALPYATVTALSTWLAARCIWNQRYWRGTAFAAAGLVGFAIITMIMHILAWR
jgi:hypothetical protein